MHQQGADRRKTAAQALRDRHQVGTDSLLLAGVQRAGAAHAAHHLVENEQNAVPVADLAHAAEVAGHGRDRAERGSDHRFGHEGDDVVAAELLDLGLELFGETRRIGLRRLIDAAIAIFIDRRDVMRLEQERRELRPLFFATTDRQRAQRDAVIALTPRDDFSPLRLAPFDEILARELERGLDRLRAAADVEHMPDAGRSMRDEIVGQLLGDLRGEEARVRVSKPVELVVHGGQHVRMRVAETRHRGAGGRVDVLLAVGIADQHALPARGDGIEVPDLAMQDVGHRVSCPALWSLSHISLL